MNRTLSFKVISGFKMVIIKEKYNIHSTPNIISELFDFAQRHNIIFKIHNSKQH